MEIEPQVNSIITEYFNSSDYKIIDLVLRGEKNTRVLEIYVDNKDGVSIDELAKINRDLNKIIDEKLFVKDISKIVVSSPGAERPVRFIWQLSKHTGRTLEIVLNDGEIVEGGLISVMDNEPGNIMLEIIHKEKKKQNFSEFREINFKDIKEVKVKISFSKK